MGQQVANSIDGFFISKRNGIVVGDQLAAENVDRAIWLANQIHADLSQVQGSRIASGQQAVGNTNTPYSLASSKMLSDGRLPSQRTTAKADINAIDTTSLLTVLEEIKNQSSVPESNHSTFSVFKVGQVKSRAINATPGRWAMLGLITMSCLVTGLVAMNQFANVKSPVNVESLSEALGIPVVAVLPIESNSKPTDDQLVSTVTSSVITLSKYFLIFAAVVIVAFSIIDSSIRDLFFQNPFDGLAKIFGVFFGHA